MKNSVFVLIFRLVSTFSEKKTYIKYTWLPELLSSSIDKTRNMRHNIFCLLIATLPYLVSTLQCHFCPQPIVVNYSVTADTVPPLENCVLIDDAKHCTVDVLWLRDPILSILIYIYDTDEKPQVNETLTMNVHLQNDGDDFARRLSHDIQYTCQMADRCNGVNTVRRIINSTTLTEQFVKQFTPLLVNVTSFTNASAAQCYSYVNVTNSNSCDPTDVDHCQRCHISIDYSDSIDDEICATCPKTTENYNKILRTKTFLLDHHSQPTENVQLWCQQKDGCNSIANIDIIRQTSELEFNYAKFFD